MIACALALGSSAVQAPFAAGAVLVGLSCSLRARPSWVLIAWVAAALTLALLVVPIVAVAARAALR
ncbi:MAG: hypothetical protein KC731_42865, partial [Myxococcales bacterium]|nr:hypothetical protein [Myxococcales bacterium]